MMDAANTPFEYGPQGLITQAFRYSIHSTIPLTVLLGLILVVSYKRINAVAHPVDAPTVGKRSVWEPYWLVRTRFFHEAWPIVKTGYRHVCFDQPVLILLLITKPVQKFQIPVRTK